MTKEIELTQGQVALIDDEDFKLISQYKWFAHWAPDTKSHYAETNVRLENGKWYNLKMHRLIMELEKGNPLQVDHINHNTLDNRKENLKVKTNQGNQKNRRKQSNNTSGYIGVGWDRKKRKWRAYIHIDKKYVHLGLFDSKHDAARRYNDVAKSLEYLILNIIEEDEQ